MQFVIIKMWIKDHCIKEHYSQIYKHLQDCGPIKSSKENPERVVEGSNLTNLVDVEVAVTICMRISLRRGIRRYPIKYSSS